MYSRLVFLCNYNLKRTHQAHNGSYQGQVQFEDNKCGLQEWFHLLELRFIYSNRPAKVLNQEVTSNVKPGETLSASLYNSLNAIAVLLNR